MRLSALPAGGCGRWTRRTCCFASRRWSGRRMSSWRACGPSWADSESNEREGGGGGGGGEGRRERARQKRIASCGAQALTLLIRSRRSVLTASRALEGDRDEERRMRAVIHSRRKRRETTVHALTHIQRKRGESNPATRAENRYSTPALSLSLFPSWTVRRPRGSPHLPECFLSLILGRGVSSAGVV